MKQVHTRIPVKLLLAGCVFFTSCINAKKIDKQVSIQYNGQLPAQKKKKAGDIVITSSYPPADSKISTTEAKTSHVLPLIFYWSFDYKNTCTLNPQIPISNLINTVNGYANKGLQQKLNGRTLELNIDSVPNKFAVDDKGHLIFFGFAYGWDNISVVPEPGNMVVSYKIKKDNLEAKQGIIVIPSFSQKQNLNFFFPKLNKALEDYITRYNENITAMAKMVINKIAAEL